MRTECSGYCQRMVVFMTQIRWFTH